FLAHVARCILPSFPTRRSSDLRSLSIKPVTWFTVSSPLQPLRQTGIGHPLGSCRMSGQRLVRERPWPECPLGRLLTERRSGASSDRKSTRLNSSHLGISYAVFC